MIRTAVGSRVGEDLERRFGNVVFRESLSGAETNLFDGTSRGGISSTIAESLFPNGRFRRGENSVTIGTRCIGFAFWRSDQSKFGDNLIKLLTRHSSDNFFRDHVL